jgi:hypothetical protein
MAQQVRIQIWVIVALIFIIWMHSAESRALGAEGEEIMAFEQLHRRRNGTEGEDRKLLDLIES